MNFLKIFRWYYYNFDILAGFRKNAFKSDVHSLRCPWTTIAKLAVKKSLGCKQHFTLMSLTFKFQNSHHTNGERPVWKKRDKVSLLGAWMSFEKRVSSHFPTTHCIHYQYLLMSAQLWCQFLMILWFDYKRLLKKFYVNGVILR